MRVRGIKAAKRVKAGCGQSLEWVDDDQKGQRQKMWANLGLD